MRRGLARLLVLGAITVGGSAIALADDGPLDPLTYTLRTVYGTPAGGQIITETPAIMIVPVPIDVDHEITTGLGGFDVLAQLTIDAGRATLRVTKLPLAPATMPLSIEAILRDPRSGLPLPLLGPPDEGLRVAFGYDALQSNAPAVYDATLAIAGADRVTSFTLDLHTALPGPTIGIIAEVYQAGEAGERLDPIKGRLDLTPVPTVAHLGILSGSDIGPGLAAGQISVDVASDIPTLGVLHIDDIQGDQEAHAVLEADKVPNTLSLVITEVEGTGQQTWSYRASAVVERIHLELTSTDAGTITQHGLINIGDMSPNATLVQDSPTHATLTSAAPIGSIEVGLAEGGLARFLTDPAYLYSFDDGTVSSLAFRVLGLEQAEIGSGDPFVVGVTMQPGPFRVLVIDGASTIEANLRDLPRTVRVSVSPANSSISYRASDPMDEFTLDATDPTGIVGRATEAHVLLRDLPTSLDVSYGAGARTATIDAGGNTLGLFEVRLTSGPDIRLTNPDEDGILYYDLPDKFVVYGRATGLKKITVNQGPPPSLDLQTTGGRIFVVDVQTAVPGGIATTAARIDRLPASLQFQFTNTTTFAYTASAPVDLVTIDAYDPAGISGRAKTLHARLESLPTAMNVAADPNGTVTLDALGGTLGLLEVQLTSGPDNRLPAEVDGILLEDLTDRYVAFVRITGLKKVVASQQPSPDVNLQTTGGRVLKVDINEWTGSKVEYTRVTLDKLQPSVRIQFVELPTGQEVRYTASAATSSISLDTNSGDRWNLHASLGSPLPASVTFCQSDNGLCTGNQRSAGAGAFKFSSSEHTTLNVFDCVRPLNASCSAPANADEYTWVNNLRIRFLEMDADSNEPIGISGYIYMNTTDGGTRHTMNGYLINENGSGGGFEADFGNGFWADKRKGSWSLWGLSKTKTGQINCAGTSLAVKVIGIWFGVTSYLC